jgi:hypothetical protein
MTNPQIDYAVMAVQWRAERETTLKVSRAELLAQLRALGISEVTAEYEGYGDSGNVEDVTVQPAEVKLSERLSPSPGVRKQRGWLRHADLGHSTRQHHARSCGPLCRMLAQL